MILLSNEQLMPIKLKFSVDRLPSFTQVENKHGFLVTSSDTHLLNNVFLSFPHYSPPPPPHPSSASPPQFQPNHLRSVMRACVCVCVCVRDLSDMCCVDWPPYGRPRTENKSHINPYRMTVVLSTTLVTTAAATGRITIAAATIRLVAAAAASGTITTISSSSSRT